MRAQVTQFRPSPSFWTCSATGEVPPPSPNPSGYYIFGVLRHLHRPDDSRASTRAKVSLPGLPALPRPHSHSLYSLPAVHRLWACASLAAALAAHPRRQPSRAAAILAASAPPSPPSPPRRPLIAVAITAVIGRCQFCACDRGSLEGSHVPWFMSQTLVMGPFVAHTGLCDQWGYFCTYARAFMWSV